jgi:hypothetical protein
MAYLAGSARRTAITRHYYGLTYPQLCVLVAMEAHRRVFGPDEYATTAVIRSAVSSYMGAEASAPCQSLERLGLAEKIHQRRPTREGLRSFSCWRITDRGSKLLRHEAVAA